MRINQLLALNLDITRRAGDDLIKAGQVKVNNKVANLGTKINAHDLITVVFKNQTHTFSSQLPAKIAFYKPPFCFAFIRSESDPKKKSIFDFLPDVYESFRPLGSLDYSSEGVQLLVNPDIDQVPRDTKQDFTEEYIVLAQSKEALSTSLEHCKGIVSVEWTGESDFDYLNLDMNNFVFCHITKDITRSSLLRQLQVDGIKIQRCINIRQTNTALTQEWYESKKHVVIIDR